MNVLAEIHWNADPILFAIGPITLRWYGLLFAGGFAVAFLLGRWIFLREGKTEKDLDGLLFTTLVATVVGARLGHVFFYEPALYLENPLLIPQIWKGGLASHGGALGILMGVWFYQRKRPDQSYLWVMDRVVVCTALVAAFIRVGNFVNSEIVGTESDLPWAVVFVRHDPFTLIARHPAQLYESLCYFVIFAVLLRLYRKRGADTPPGSLLGVFLVTVFSVRVLVEFVKERQVAWEADLPLSMGQLLSLPLIAAGVWLLVRAKKAAAAATPPSPRADDA